LQEVRDNTPRLLANIEQGTGFIVQYRVYSGAIDYCQWRSLLRLWRCCILSFLLSSPVAFAQYRFDVWTTNDGLPHNNVLNIQQTRDGFLWLATVDGLVRYDGVRFKIFNTGNTKGLKGARFRSLFEDSQGTLWVNSENNGLVRYKDGKFFTFTAREGLPHNAVTLVREKAAGSLYIETVGGAVCLEGEKIIPCEALGKKSDAAKLEQQWFLDRNGLHALTNGQARLIQPLSTLTVADIKSRFFPTNGWVVADKKKPGQFSAAPANIRLDVTRNYIYAICEDRRGNFWISTSGGGLLHLKNGKFTFLTTADGLPSNEINSVYEDREGNIWVGTTRGLCRLRNQIITAHSTQQGLAANNVYPIFQDSKDSVWIGSWKGLTRYAGNTFTNYSEAYKVADNLVTAIAEDQSGNLWLGTWDDGLRKIKGEHVTRIQDKILFDNPVHAICPDHAGTLWIGTSKGLVKFKDGEISLYSMKDGLSGNYINVIHEDRQGTLWIGTELGLTEYRDGAFRVYGEAEGFSGYTVRSIYEDREGLLWFGTYDGGLNRLKDGIFTRYTMNEGLANNGVFQILEDGRGDFWMSCNLGIYRVRRDELNDFAEGRASVITSIFYDHRDGMLNPECNGGGQPAGLKAKDGRLWFPTQAGVAVIDINRVQVNSAPPPVRIEEVVVENSPFEFQDAVEISPDKSNFEISYAGLSFVMTAQIKFKYMLEGLDKDWVDAGTRRTAYYSHVPPGEYNFVVIAANRDGVWNMDGAKVRVIIVPPFWKTRWFLAALLVSFVGLAALLYTLRVSSLKQAKAAQEEFSKRLIESQENDRKRIAAELHDSLSQNIVVIKNRARLAIKTLEDPDKAKAQLNEISMAADEAIDEVSEISYNLRPFQLDRLGLSKAIEAMLKKISTASDITFTMTIDDLKGVFPQSSEINLYRIVQESINNIVKHAQATKAEVEITKDAYEVRLMIRDNGVGFQTGTVNINPLHYSGFGLTGIAERVRIIGGKYSIQSVPGAGTTVMIDIAIPENK
jgi:ligand-binding sensor domain-containing protein/signal transduction histidine kinase